MLQGILFDNKKNEVFMHAIALISLKNIMISKRSQMQRTIYYMTPFV